MILRVHKCGKDIVVAACDDELLDKTIRCGELRIHVSKKFYGEEVGSEEELVAALRICTSANLVGDEAVGAATKAGFIQKGGVMKIGDVPHAQLYKIPGLR